MRAIYWHRGAIAKVTPFILGQLRFEGLRGNERERREGRKEGRLWKAPQPILEISDRRPLFHLSEEMWPYKQYGQ